MSSIYEVLRRPLVTEKTNYMANSLHKYVFEVSKEASRSVVKDAVEQIFDVKVLNVNIINVPAKRTRRAKSRRLVVRNSGYKKAIVTLAPEDSIAIFEGVE